MQCVVSAFKLDDGVVVYLTADDEWSPEIHLARVTNSEDEAVVALGIGENAENSGIVIGACLVDVEISSSGIRPKIMKELIRAGGGPTCSPKGL